MSIDRMDVESIEQLEGRLMTDLPSLAKELIERRGENLNLIENPDDPAEHEPKWHQFGILTHTSKFLEMYRSEEQGYLEEWEVSGNIRIKMAESVDGRSKADLMAIAILLHDIGKFARGLKEKDGKSEPDYSGHETKSEQIIGETLKSKLSLEYALTPDQIGYIGRCAGLHYELGKIRSQAKELDTGYSIAFAKSDVCGEMVTSMAEEHQDYKTEIGLLFLGDSLAKTDIVVSAETDEDLDGKSGEIEQILAQRGLNPKLIQAVKQRSVNIAVAKRYFQEMQNAPQG